MSGGGMKESLVRTVVPVIVGALIAWGVGDWIAADAETLTELVTPIVIALYYAGARVLERYVSPKFGWLLGLRTEPSYDVVPGKVYESRSGIDDGSQSGR